MNIDPNPLYYYMVKTYSEKKTKDNQIAFCHEGGMRSAKTWSVIQFVVTFLINNPNKDLKVFFFRKTLTDCRDILYNNDFVPCLKEMGIYATNNARSEKVSPEYTINGNTIIFGGVTSSSGKKTEPTWSDIFYYNEVMDEDSQHNIDGWIDRCKKVVIFDWNPKYTMHWIFDWEGRPNVYFTKTTYLSNKHLDPVTKTKIESKSPWHLDDLHLPENERRPHKENIKNNTVDKWSFIVYGMGERANRDGLVIPNVRWVKEMTKDSDTWFYGLDFGNTTGIFALAVGCFNQDGIHFDCPIYGSFATTEEITEDNQSGLKSFWDVFKIWFLENHDKDFDMLIIADSSNPNFINDLNLWANADGFKNVMFSPVKKFEGCVNWRLDIIKRHKITLVDRKHIRVEQENYAYETISGVRTNRPKKGFDHFWDGAGYGSQYVPELRI